MDKAHILYYSNVNYDICYISSGSIIVGNHSNRDINKNFIINAFIDATTNNIIINWDFELNTGYATVKSLKEIIGNNKINIFKINNDIVDEELFYNKINLNK